MERLIILIWNMGHSENRVQNLKAFEMSCYWGMLKIPWVAKLVNVEVLRRAEKRLTAWNMLKMRRNETIWNILRREDLLQTIIEGKVEGWNRSGRPRNEYMQRRWRRVSLLLSSKKTGREQRGMENRCHCHQPIYLKREPWETSFPKTFV